MRIADRSLENVDRINNEQAELIEQTEGQSFANDQFRTRQGSLDRAPGQFKNAGEEQHNSQGRGGLEQHDQRFSLLEMMRRVLLGDLTALQTAPLEPAQQRAMELLQAAVIGRDPVAHVIVFAEDRRMMLEQSIAALQPLIGMGGMHSHDDVTQSQSMFSRVLGDVNQLRETLEKLESTQDEFEQPVVTKKSTSSDDDGDDVDENDEDDSNDDSEDDADNGSDSKGNDDNATNSNQHPGDDADSATRLTLPSQAPAGGREVSKAPLHPKSIKEPKD